ncbi:hypothetical protein JD969_11225 [Planctomycetota bacterium]|nr:hypothetical protein JD969_11225 [Planctomycetota bacterium]
MSMVRFDYGTATLLSVVMTASAYASPINTVVVTGEASGLGGQTFQGFDRVDLNNRGQIVFQSTIDDDVNDQSVGYANYYVDGSGTRHMLDATSADHAWLIRHQKYGNVLAPPQYRTQINDRGTIAYVKVKEYWQDGWMYASSNSSFEVVKVNANSLQKQVLAKSGDDADVVVPEGWVVDGEPYVFDRFSPLDYLNLTENDRISFSSTIKRDESTAKQGLYEFVGESGRGVFVEGDGAEGPFNANAYEPFKFNVNANGNAVFASSGPMKAGTSGTYNATVSYYDAVNDEVKRLMLAGDDAFGIADAKYQTGPKHRTGMSFNDNNTALITMYLETSFNNSAPALYLYKDGELSLYASSYMYDAANGGEFGYVYSVDVLNNEDQFLFMAHDDLNQPPHELYFGDADGYERVYVDGDVAMGLEELGYKYGYSTGEGVWRDQEQFQLNDRGIAAFFVKLTHGTEPMIEALYSWHEKGAMDLVAYEGMDLGVTVDGEVEMKVIESFDYNVMDLNEKNLFAFGVNFTDGSSGIFTATVIPEPMSGLGLMGLGMLGLLRRRLAG